jgi:hypothetical protein
MTISDVRRMDELKIFEWEYYEREQQRLRLQQLKLENPREITKVAKVKDFWEEELRQGKNRRLKKD